MSSQTPKAQCGVAPKTKAFGVSCARLYTLQPDIPEFFISSKRLSTKTKPRQHTHRETKERNGQASEEFFSNIEAGKKKKQQAPLSVLTLPNLVLTPKIFPTKGAGGNEGL